MQLKVEQLDGLKKRHPVYLLTGNEPFQLLTARDTLRRQAAAAGFAERQLFDFSDGKHDWPALLDACQSLGLFASRRLVEIRLGEKRPDKKASETLQAALKLAGDELLLIISCSQLNSKRDTAAAWYKAIDQIGAVIKIWPVTHRELPQRTQWMLQKAGLDADPDALQLLAARSEGNLLALSQEIEKLAPLHESHTRLTCDHIRDSVADSSHFTLFDLTAATSDGQTQRALRILDHLREEGEAPTLIVWTLGRDLEAMEALSLGLAPTVYLPNFRQAGLKKRASRLGCARIQALLQLAFKCDTQIKGRAPGDPWNSLAALVVAITGKPLPAAFNQ